MKRALLLLAFTCLSTPSLADPLFPDMTAARDAARIGDFTQAAQNWEPLADFGIAEAQLELGLLYNQGKGVERDEKKAFRLIRRSAEAGLPRAYVPLGRLYEDGSGAPRNLTEAEKSYRHAQENGDPRGTYHLGRLYERHPLFAPAAQAHATQADALLQKVESGHFAYAEQLAHHYAEGNTAPRDPYRAYVYMTVAARAGSSTASQHAAMMKQNMNSTLAAKAEKTAENLIIRIRAPGFKEAGAAPKFTNPKDKAALAPLPLPDKNAGYRAAAQQYRRAIDEGYFRAARNLGQLYEKGRGVDENKPQALTYYYVARDSGVEQAQSLVAAMESLLDPAAIARARSDADTILAARPAAAVKQNDNPRFFGIVKTMAMAEDNHDLGTRRDTLETGLGIDGRIGAFYDVPGRNMRTYGEVRGYKSTGVIDTRDDDGDDVMSEGFVELRQIWAEFYNLGGDPRLAAKFGRQRFREDRGLWWNTDLDAARLSLNSTLTTGFIALGHNFDNYRLGENDDFRERDQNRLRLLGEIGHRLTTHHTVEARFLMERDLSRRERVGDIFKADDIDSEDSDLLWMGLRGHGSVPAGRTMLGYHLEGLAVTGEETVNDSTLGPGGGQRIVTGTRDRDVAGWAFDSALSLTLLGVPLSPTITAGYAYGSGDDRPAGRGDDNAFRQTDMQGNTSLISGSDPDMGRMRHYGEVLRPELSNIHVLSLGAHVPLMENGALGFHYFNYWLDEKTGGLRSSGISAPLNGTDSYLGQAMDVVVYMPIAQNMRDQGSWLESIGSRFVIGGFMAGDAYGTAEDDIAWRGTAELRVRF